MENSEELISRQAAIRWVKTECNPYGKPTIDFKSGIKVIEYLKNIPSIQPDQLSFSCDQENDVISRKAAIDVINAILPAEPMKNEYTQGITCGAALAIEYVKQLPSAEPKRKTGQWIYLAVHDKNARSTDHIAAQCPFCKFAYDTTAAKVIFDYCPNCGADMRGLA